jgi:homoserine kinase
MNRAVRVTVPATSANLGPGFDALGLALDLHDVIEAHTVPAEAGGGSLTVAVEGIGADDLPRDASHLVVQAMQVVFKLAGQEPSAIDLRCVNGIPLGRGLGSSAAAIVAGVLAARALVDGGPDLVDDEAVLAVAAGLEGHPDNVAPCLLGGLTLAWNPGEQARAIRLDVHPDLRPVLCVPEQTLPTEAARGLLPDVVPHGDASHNAARAALLVEALRSRPDLLLDATEDHLHQDYRAEAMPETLALVTRLRSSGLPAVVSGAGPSVLVLTGPSDTLAEVRDVVGAGNWQVRALGIDHGGAVVESI